MTETSEKSDISLGEVAYKAYARSTTGRTFDGRQMPSWAKLPANIREAWHCAAVDVHETVTGTAHVAESPLTRRAFSVSIYIQSVVTNRVLLIEHKRHGLWLPIGGERKGNETPTETAYRKVREETRWDPNTLAWSTFPHHGVRKLLGAPDGLLGYEEHESGERGLHMNFVFLARMDQSERMPSSDGSWSYFAWSSLDSQRKMPANVKQILEMLLHANGVMSTFR